MEDLQINNWIILDPLGNIYVIYANLTMITLLNPLMITHFWRTQAEVCLKGTLVKASFMFVPILVDFHENRRRKSIINPSCPKHSLIVNGDKKWHKFLFLTSLWCLKKVLSFWGSKKNCEKKIYHFPLLIRNSDSKGEDCVFVKLPTYVNSVSLTLEIWKNNIDTSRVANIPP